MSSEDMPIGKVTKVEGMAYARAQDNRDYYMFERLCFFSYR